MITRKTDSINVRMAPDLKKRLAVIADANEMSLSDLARMAIIAELPVAEKGLFKLRGVSEVHA